MSRLSPFERRPVRQAAQLLLGGGLIGGQPDVVPFPAQEEHRGQEGFRMDIRWRRGRDERSHSSRQLPTDPLPGCGVQAVRSTQELAHGEG